MQGNDKRLAVSYFYCHDELMWVQRNQAMVRPVSMSLRSVFVCVEKSKQVELFVLLLSGKNKLKVCNLFVYG